MKRTLITACAAIALTATAVAQDSVELTINTNKSCMPWLLNDIGTTEIFGDKCPGYDETLKMVRGTCTLRVPPGAQYRYQWGGHQAWLLKISDDGLVEYNKPQTINSLQPGQSSISLSTSKLRLQKRGFPGTFVLEGDNVPCKDDSNPTKRESRLFIVNGADFRVITSYGVSGESPTTIGQTFRTREDGQLEKILKVSLAGSNRIYHQDPLITGHSPNRIRVNRMFWNYPKSTDTEEEQPTQ